MSDVRSTASVTAQSLYSSVLSGKSRSSLTNENAELCLAEIERNYGPILSWQSPKIACKPVTGEWVATVHVKRQHGNTIERVYGSVGDSITSISAEPESSAD